MAQRGRPTKYKEEFCELIEKEIAKGYSKEAACSKLGTGIDRDTLYAWDKKYPDFSHAIKKGEAKALYLCESLGIAKMTGKDIKMTDGTILRAKDIDTTMIIFEKKTRWHKVYGIPTEDTPSANIQILISEDDKKL